MVDNHYNSRVYDRFGIPCEVCGTKDRLTKHHVKNDYGSKTGDIQILCRECHDAIEEQYWREGKIKAQVPPMKPRSNDRLFLDYINGFLPYYSLGRPTWQKKN